MDEVVAAAWDKVVEDWSNQSRHDALMALVVERQAFKWAAGKYRERKGDAIADAQLAKLTTATMATMMASAGNRRATDPNSAYKRALLWLLALAVMLVFGLIAAKLMVSGHHPASP